MPTVAEVLKQSGMTDEQIAALDQKVTSAFDSVLSTAEQQRLAAEAAAAAQHQEWIDKISPALDTWTNGNTAAQIESSTLKAAVKASIDAGFTVPDTVKAMVTGEQPQPRNAGGRFETGNNPVPGSPQFVEGLRSELGSAFSTIADLQWKYRTLHGTEMPDSPTTIIKEAAASKMPPLQYAAQKYKFAEKEAEKVAAAEKQKIDAAVQAAVSAKEKEFAEKYGSNPDVRRAEASAFSALDKGVKAGTSPDPLKLSPQERRQATKAAIVKDITDNMSKRVQ